MRGEQQREGRKHVVRDDIKQNAYMKIVMQETWIDEFGHTNHRLFSNIYTLATLKTEEY